MLRKNQRSCLLNEFQLRLFKGTNERLCRLNRAAFCELRRIRFRHLSNRQCSEAGKVFRTIATQMVSTLQLRQEIVIAGREQQPQQILVVIRSRCATCAEKRRPNNRDDEQSASREALEVDPEYQTEIDSLLELVCQTEERVSKRQRSRGDPPRRFFEGISRLRSALLKQHRHLRDIAAHQTSEIEVQIDCSTCKHCRKPMKNEDENDAMKVALSDASHLRKNGGEL